MTYIYRPLSEADYNAYYHIMKDEVIAKYGNFNMTQEEVLNELPDDNWEMSQRTQLVFTEDNQIVGYQVLYDAQTLPVNPVLVGYVRPEHRGQGIGTALLEWGIKTAENVFQRVPNDARVIIRAYAMDDNEGTLLQSQGFTTNRQSLQMERTLEDDIPQANFPDSIDVITMAEHPNLTDFIRIQRESFRDHRGFTEAPLEKVVAKWQRWIDSASDFDPELFLMLRENSEDVGVCLMWQSSEEDPDKAWLDVIGIMPDYRRRGLASDLLKYGFNLLKARGIPKVALSVDGSSLTGADKLYRNLGMHVAYTIDAYELELREGVEMSNQG